MEIALYLLLFAFLVMSGISSYRLGYSRGLLKGIITSEMFRVNESMQIKVSEMMWKGDPENDNGFPGLDKEIP